MPFRPDAIVYHYPCSDGAASAALLADFYENDSSIQWIRGNYSNTALLDEIVAATSGKTVLFVDFSLKADAMAHLQTVAKTIVVLDHHDSALREFAKLGPDVILDPLTADNFNVNATYADGFYAFMRMDMSGVGLTYRWLYGFDNELPRAVALTQAIDLGQDHTANDSAMSNFKWYSRSLPTDVERLHNDEEFAANVLLPFHVPDKIFQQGQAVKRFVDLCVTQYTEQARVVQYTVGEETYTVPTAFASYAFASDVASALIYKRDGGKYDMAVCIYFNENGMGLSLRSKSGVECNAVAETFGGGGHKQAAGANIEWADVLEFVQNIIPTITVQQDAPQDDNS